MKKLTPVLTEKSLSDADEGKYTFVADPSLTKDQLRMLVSKTFGVSVKTIKTANQKSGVKKTYAGKRKKIKALKKLTVTLGEKEKIDLFEKIKK